MLAGAPCFPPGWSWIPAVEHSGCERQECWQRSHSAGWRGGSFFLSRPTRFGRLRCVQFRFHFLPYVCGFWGIVREHEQDLPQESGDICTCPSTADISFNCRTRAVGRYGLLWIAQQRLENFSFVGRMSLSCLYTWFPGTLDSYFALLLFIAEQLFLQFIFEGSKSD